MEFEWDENKAESNLAKHNLAFTKAAKVFADPFKITHADTRKDYGETREITIGQIEGEIVVTVVSTDRTGKRRLISARRANKKERKEYHEQNN